MITMEMMIMTKEIDTVGKASCHHMVKKFEDEGDNDNNYRDDNNQDDDDNDDNMATMTMMMVMMMGWTNLFQGQTKRPHHFSIPVNALSASFI